MMMALMRMIMMMVIVMVRNCHLVDCHGLLLQGCVLLLHLQSIEILLAVLMVMIDPRGRISTIPHSSMIMFIREVGIHATFLML